MPSSFFLEMAAQRSVARRGADGFEPACFDWENKITAKLGFQDLCHVLAVLEGKAEFAGGKRDGLYHRNGRGTTVIRFRRGENGGYLVGLSRKGNDEEEAQRIGTVLSEAEAVGLRHVLALGLYFMSVPHAA